MKKTLAMLIITSLLVTTIVGCGSSNEEPDEATSNSGDGVEQTEPLRWAIKASESGREEYQNLIDLAADNGIEVETVVLPDAVVGEVDKLLVDLMGGESFDLILGPVANMVPYYNAGVLEPLDGLAEAVGYDMEGIYGDYPAVFDGVVYGVPAFVDTAVTLYNKDLFDAAGISYPSADNWTWEEYIKVGKQLTEAESNIYGGFNPLWAHYNYMYAMQKGAEHFNDDGTSNYDDLLFKEAVEFYYGLGNIEGVHPEFLVQESKQMPIDYFTTGKVGMSVAGGWTTVWLTDTEKYPRDWKAGMLPMPYPEGEDPSTSVVVSSYFVPETSKQKELAFECAVLFAENQYLMDGGRVPARIDLTDDEISTYIEEELAPSLSDDGITVEDIRAAWFNPEIIPFAEKVVGPAAADINKAFTDECGLYGIGEQDIDTTMKNIKERADKAIEDTNDQ